MEKSGLCKDWGVMFFYNNIGRGNYLNLALLLKGEEFIYDSLEIRELWGGRFGIINKAKLCSGMCGICLA